MNYQCIVSGKVQGVFYRSYVQGMASDAGFDGYVRNLPNGDVEACVTTNDEKKLANFLEILKQGSPYCRVNNINTQTIDTIFSSGFSILR